MFNYKSPTMKKTFSKLQIILNFPRILPVWFIYKILRLIKPEVRKIDTDVNVWKKWKSVNSMPFFYLFVKFPEFRSVVYYRIGIIKFLVKWLYQPLKSLYISTPQIGDGLMIQHGFSTIIAAEKLGANCRIFQQVTIGYNGDKRPIIGDNVIVCCGAKIIGGVTIGNNVTIGANAVVCKDVPDNCVVAGVPAKIIRRI